MNLNDQAGIKPRLNEVLERPNHGTLTERESSERLTSSLR
jgi:hypothetical protein